MTITRSSKQLSISSLIIRKNNELLEDSWSAAPCCTNCNLYLHNYKTVTLRLHHKTHQHLFVCFYSVIMVVIHYLEWMQMVHPHQSLTQNAQVTCCFTHQACIQCEHEQPPQPGIKPTFCETVRHLQVASCAAGATASTIVATDSAGENWKYAPSPI